MPSPPEGAGLSAPALEIHADAGGLGHAQFRLGAGTADRLQDHRFEGLTLIPGSLYVAMAAQLERRLMHDAPHRLRNVTFYHPVVVGGGEVVIDVTIEESGDGWVEHQFHEISSGPESHATEHRRVASLEIQRGARGAHGAPPGEALIERLQSRADLVLEGEEFYARLGARGNEYGPSFRQLGSIWRAGAEALGRISCSESIGEWPSPQFDPLLLDAMTQLLAVFLPEDAGPFVLRSIGEVRLGGSAVPAGPWVYGALRRDPGSDRHVGDVRLLDEAGAASVELSEVVLTTVGSAGEAAEGAKPAERLVIAANFTAEPLADSLDFWSAQFGAPLRVEFAPYNQVFQQLLEPASALHANATGVNAVLLELGQWVGRRAQSRLPSKIPSARQAFASHPTHVLPNGLEIAHLNPYETDYLYREIFEDECYLRHGIVLESGATVVDIGANIGMFSLFVLSQCPDAEVYAFEPAPAVYDLLRANCDVYGRNLHAFNLGVSDLPGAAAFTFYRQSSVFSGFHASELDDREAVQAVVRNVLRRSMASDESVERYVEELTADRLRPETHECSLTSVSEIVREHRLERIDLLKIDAEKSELAIVQGIEDQDWPKIQQLVIEVHDHAGGAVERLRGLLAERGFRCAVEREALLEDSGFYNLYATRSGEGRSEPVDELDRNIQDFQAALESFKRQTSAPLVLGVCPPIPMTPGDPVTSATLAKREGELLAAASRVPNVSVVPSSLLLRRHSLPAYFDAHGHEVAHMPYTRAAYVAIGTELFRKLHQLKRPPFKVLALDCDNTLWKGVCGEDGATGVEVGEAYRALQDFVVEQTTAGMLICLCSKNNEADVFDVFDHNPGMALRREHLVGWRINWRSKSENLIALAHELGVGLDSFVFIDDDPRECAEVRMACPEVVTLQLPSDSTAIPRFLDHVWPFDRADSTPEDERRTRMYQDEARRTRLRGQSSSLRDFIEALDLRVDVTPLTERDVPRAAQLTHRTNQFNFTTVRRSDQDFHDLLKRRELQCLTVRVADRFGDYGLVGVVIYAPAADRYVVDTFLLSCRVLGRGVEHAVLSHLAGRAVSEGKRFVELAYRETDRNKPAFQFLESVGAAEELGGSGSCALEARRLAGLEYRPHETMRLDDASSARDEPDRRQRSTSQYRKTGQSELFQSVAEQWSDIDRLTEAVHPSAREIDTSAEPVHVGSPLEGALLTIWRDVLGRSEIGLDDTFFDVGGTSLRAVQVIAAIKRELQRDVSIVTLFEFPTIHLLAEALSAEAGSSDQRVTSAAERGQRRRSLMRRERA